MLSQESIYVGVDIGLLENKIIVLVSSMIQLVSSTLVHPPLAVVIPEQLPTDRCARGEPHLDQKTGREGLDPLTPAPAKSQGYFPDSGPANEGD